jgi:replicative DNA helicase
MPELSDTRESGSIENDADVVMFTMIPAKYGIEELNGESIDENIALVRIAKSRQGQTARFVKLLFMGEFVTIKNLERY